MENFGEKNQTGIEKMANDLSSLKEKSELEQRERESGNFSEKPLSVAEEMELEKLKVGTANVIKCFALKRSADNKKGENLLIVTDAGVDEFMLRAFYESGRQIAGNDCRIMVAPKTEHPAQGLGKIIGEKMKSVDALLLVTSLSRSHSKESRDVMHPFHSQEIIEKILSADHLIGKMQNLRQYETAKIIEKLEKRKISPESELPARARIISITNTKRETLMVGGALEDPIEMVKRIDEFAEAVKGVEKVRITSENGTDLELDLKVPTFMKEDGLVTEPGQIANFPSGEYAGSVDLAGTNGVYVVDGAVGVIGRISEPIKITIANGVATKIEGGPSAQKLKEILDKAEKEYQEANPEDKTTSAFRLAEFAFGMNSKAFRYEDGKRVSPPTSLEGEKGLGTIHIALGRNSLFSVAENDPDYNDIPIHIDCVAMQTSITGFKDDGEKLEIIKNGEVVCL